MSNLQPRIIPWSHHTQREDSLRFLSDPQSLREYCRHPYLTNVHNSLKRAHLGSHLAVALATSSRQHAAGFAAVYPRNITNHLQQEQQGAKQTKL
eukprot:298862-Amphidinium_carterae.1